MGYMMMMICLLASVAAFAVSQVALDALAAGMLVTLLLDFWRITVGGIVDSPAAAAGLQWAVEVQA
jgi:hypothetical protein